MDRFIPRPTGGNSGARSLADAALDYAAHGLPVLPLWWAESGRCACGAADCSTPGKHPLGRLAPNGVKNATTDPALIAEWQRRFPRHNVGLACVGFWALDVDGQEGLDTLADLEDLNRWLPEGPASVTGSGGMHLLFPANDRARNSVKFLPGLDTRAAGGYVVAPPSVHPTGNRYAWLPGREPWSVPLPEAPPWLLDLLDPPKTTVAPAARASKTEILGSRYVRAAVANELERIATASQGQRNNSLFRVTAKLGKRFLLTGEISEAPFRSALLGAAMAAGLPHQEAQRTIESGLRAAKGNA
jgi:hypothetical protein